MPSNLKVRLGHGHVAIDTVEGILSIDFNLENLRPLMSYHQSTGYIRSYGAQFTPLY